MVAPFSNGNRTKVTTTDRSGTKSVNYTYDALNQLLSETDPTTGNTVSNTYDPLGNRSTKVVKDSAGNVLSTTKYEYNAANELTSVDKNPYVYDQNGNVVDDGTKLYTWDTGGSLTEVKDKATGNVIADYSYDEQGRRVSKTVNGVVTKYVYDGDSIRVLYETNASNQITCYYTYNASGLLLSMTKIGGGTYFYHYNAHGDVIAVTDINGNVAASYTYDAWGNILASSGTFADQNPYRYAGYRYDPETGFYYLMARYYNPGIGRFLSLDPTPGTSDDPVTQNGYTYTNNNPVMGLDPDGNFAWVAGIYFVPGVGEAALLATTVVGGAYGAWYLGKKVKSWANKKSWDHIKEGHSKDSSVPNKGKFRSNRTMKRTTRATARTGKVRPGNYGRTIHEKEFKTYVGRNGNKTARVAVIREQSKNI